MTGSYPFKVDKLDKGEDDRILLIGVVNGKNVTLELSKESWKKIYDYADWTRMCR